MYSCNLRNCHVHVHDNYVYVPVVTKYVVMHSYSPINGHVHVRDVYSVTKCVHCVAVSSKYSSDTSLTTSAAGRALR